MPFDTRLSQISVHRFAPSPLPPPPTPRLKNPGYAIRVITPGTFFPINGDVPLESQLYPVIEIGLTDRLLDADNNL